MAVPFCLANQKLSKFGIQKNNDDQNLGHECHGERTVDIGTLVKCISEEELTPFCKDLRRMFCHAIITYKVGTGILGTIFEAVYFFDGVVTI